MVKRHGDGYICEVTNTWYPTREEAEVSERAAKDLREAMKKYADGDMDELDMAEALQMPLETERQRAQAMVAIKGMYGQVKGASTVGYGTFLGDAAVHSQGRIQIPAALRREMHLEDGSIILWFRKDGLYHIVNSENIPWTQGKLR